MELNDLVKVYDNVLDHDTCKSWIEYFESSDNKEKLYENGYPNWYHLWVDYGYPVGNMVRKLEKYKDIYFRDIAKHYDGYFPSFDDVYYYLEQWKIKRYNPGLDEKYDPHVDNIDFDTSERYLTFIFYLNDVKEGGETVFEHRKIQPKEGRLVVFPPMWMFPHSGNSPISNTKYIMSSYLRYDKVLMEDSDGEN